VCTPDFVIQKRASMLPARGESQSGELDDVPSPLCQV
jgi:hypothetical protein